MWFSYDTTPISYYSKVPKFLDTHSLYYKLSKIQRFYHGVIPQNDANGIGNSEDLVQTAAQCAV